ncbi:MAG: NAD(P)H-binding protein [Bacteroidales bacterium]|nr:NAD(P)H-binding protein [Bacteroidales bacterium]
MKVLLIGATGATGQIILPLLLSAGHTVTALVRRPEAVTVEDEHLVVMPGGVRDPEQVDQAVKGQDAVMCAFGPRGLGKDDIQEVLMRNLVQAMTKHGVKRLVNLSARGSSDSHKSMGLMGAFFIKVLLRNVFADKKRGEQLLFASDLDFVNACPGRLLNKPATGNIKASADGTGITSGITRADVARWMVEQLTSDTWVRQSPVIG